MNRNKQKNEKRIYRNEGKESPSSPYHIAIPSSQLSLTFFPFIKANRRTKWDPDTQKKRKSLNEGKSERKEKEKGGLEKRPKRTRKRQDHTFYINNV